MCVAEHEWPCHGFRPADPNSRCLSQVVRSCIHRCDCGNRGGCVSHDWLHYVYAGVELYTSGGALHWTHFAVHLHRRSLVDDIIGSNSESLQRGSLSHGGIPGSDGNAISFQAMVTTLTRVLLGRSAHGGMIKYAMLHYRVNTPRVSVHSCTASCCADQQSTECHTVFTKWTYATNHKGKNKAAAQQGWLSSYKDCA